jgi:hemolysin-activating ACP:hemolysin acyltransferase
MAVFPLSTLLAQLDLPKDRLSTHALAVGLAFQCLERQKASSDLRSMFDRLLPPIFANQYEFYVDHVGRVIGFLTWATTDSEGSKLLIEHGSNALANAQWSAGNDLWVIDFAAFDEQLPAILCALRDTRFMDLHAVTYGRHKEKIRLVKQMSRKDRNSFILRKSRPATAPLNLTKRFDILHAHAASLRISLDLGNALLATRASAQHLQSSVSSVMHTFREALAIRQCRTYFDDAGEPQGIVAWAWLSEATIARMHTTPIQEVHTSEWNEGQQLCFFDISINDSIMARVSSDIIEQLYPEESTALMYTSPSNGASGVFMKVDRRSRRADLEGWLKLQLDHNATFQQRH